MSERNYSIEEIQKAATRVRKNILRLAIERGGCYLGQACSSAEIMASLYMKILKLGPSLGSMEALPFPGVPGPDNMDYPKGSLYHGAFEPDKDRFFVSPAHYASVVYCTLAECGRISREAIDKFNVDGWNMEMIGAEHSPGFECTAGSLGQTISIACGTAHARKLKKETGKVYVLLSDGEIEEGQAWEAFQAASFYRLDNLVIYIDVNGQQVEGYTKDVMDIEPLTARLEAFGTKTADIDGHDIQSLIDASTVEHTGKPLAVLCRTSAARGIPLLEKRIPFLHFVRIDKSEIDEYRCFCDQMCE
ncbi:MAG TPA: 1-deoxy-D-xylulose-5-phosphate synthase N-terminal domain-containing protein [Anaerovoracaceae bacterium]|nr:1-deoxy-D-xylulose-5-phosphate synthase N-terminal domain-containing protein [Anaerovoracaceae bacterium]